MSNSLSRAQKQALASALISHAADYLEFWDERITRDEALQDIDINAAAEQLSVWLKHLPGKDWDQRLPLPKP